MKTKKHKIKLLITKGGRLLTLGKEIIYPYDRTLESKRLKKKLGAKVASGSIEREIEVEVYEEIE